MDIRGMDVRPAAKAIPDILKADSSIGKVTILPKALPFTPWSDGESQSFTCESR
jgi:hypothetical protein